LFYFGKKFTKYINWIVLSRGEILVDCGNACNFIRLRSGKIIMMISQSQ